MRTTKFHPWFSNNEIDRDFNFKITTTSFDSDELKSILKETISVPHCHHRNTHKNLLKRLREFEKGL